jgi:Spy/CpxP family protein refolding chaperone
MRCARITLLLLFAAAPAAAQKLPGPGNRWWQNSETVAKLNLTPEQRWRIELVFRENRIKLIDLTAALDKEEALMEPMMFADPPDAAKIRAQIDRVAQARAELEKANANMLLGMRLVLTLQQWETLQSSGPTPRIGPMPRKLR